MASKSTGQSAISTVSYDVLSMSHTCIQMLWEGYSCSHVSRYKTTVRFRGSAMPKVMQHICL